MFNVQRSMFNLKVKLNSNVQFSMFNVQYKGHAQFEYLMFNLKVVKEDMFKYSTTKLGKAMEKVEDSVNTMPMTLICIVIGQSLCFWKAVDHDVLW